jgi:N-acetylmuramoyl-L-alanine amidase
MTRDSRQAVSALPSFRQWLYALLIAALLSGSSFAATVAQKKQIARTQFETAERMREALNGRPEKQRREADYKQVIEAYRKVYYTAPSSNKADAAVVALAELLAEKGRAFKNEATLVDAVGQYEFLRKEYPGSKYRVQALFTMAQIYKDDLNDIAKAKETFQEYLKHYPNSQLAPDARAALKELDQPAESAKAASEKPKATKGPRKEETKAEPAVVKATAAEPKSETTSAEIKEVKQTTDEAQPRATKALVTGVRHWSTPDYTRIAIDLEDEIQYDSGRIPSPDRIYFDLKGTRLSSVLKGKSFDVDDGFLKQIRVAQFVPGVTRIVLEVGDDVGEYSAFLLPNPYRLIVDIHGKQSAKLMARTPGLDKTDKPKFPAPSAAKNESAPITRVPEKKQQETIAKAVEQKEVPKSTEIKATEAKAAVDPKPADSKYEPKEVAKADTPKSDTSRSKSKGEVATKIVEPEPEQPKPELMAKATLPELKADSKAPEIRSDSKPSKTTESKKEEPPLRLRGKKRQAPEKLAGREAQPTTNGDRSLIRALGLKIGRIVVDAGHGGHDTGTIGPNGLREKDLVLDVALRLGKLLQDRLGADVVYTRDDDTFIPLETRTAIANQQQADLFISIHANSSNDEAARGVETYYLNFTSSRDALEVAARENAVSEKSIHELQDLVKKIALKEKIEESREFALDVQNSLHGGLASKAPAIRDRGVKKAPFIVLIGANMPSILAEISFISNPTDEKKLQTPDYRQKIADSLFKGVNKYVNGLSGVKVASKLMKEETGN